MSEFPETLGIVLGRLLLPIVRASSSAVAVKFHEERSGVPSGTCIEVDRCLAETFCQALARECKVEPRSAFGVPSEAECEAGLQLGVGMRYAIEVDETEAQQFFQCDLFFLRVPRSPGRSVGTDLHVEVAAQYAVPLAVVRVAEVVSEPIQLCYSLCDCLLGL